MIGELALPVRRERVVLGLMPLWKQVEFPPLVEMARGKSVEPTNPESPLEIARHPILKVTCKHFALPWSHC